MAMVESCPKLQEIGLFGALGVRPPRQQFAIPGLDAPK